MIIKRLRRSQLHSIINAPELVDEFQDKLETLIKSDFFHVAVYNDKAIGFATTSVKAYGDEVVGYLEAAFVSVEYRGNEVFSRLYQDIVSGFKEFNIERIQLEVDYNNADAYDIYRHLGFENKVVLMERHI